eukprot:scaffold5808_cov128-Isochrysis_galbana.AAC.21
MAARVCDRSEAICSVLAPTGAAGAAVPLGASHTTASAIAEAGAATNSEAVRDPTSASAGTFSPGPLLTGWPVLASVAGAQTSVGARAAGSSTAAADGATSGWGGEGSAGSPEPAPVSARAGSTAEPSVAVLGREIASRVLSEASGGGGSDAIGPGGAGGVGAPCGLGETGGCWAVCLALPGQTALEAGVTCPRSSRAAALVSSEGAAGQPPSSAAAAASSRALIQRMSVRTRSSATSPAPVTGALEGADEPIRSRIGPGWRGGGTGGVGLDQARSGWGRDMLK